MNKFLKNTIAFLITIVFILTSVILVIKTDGNIISSFISNKIELSDIDTTYDETESFEETSSIYNIVDLESSDKINEEIDKETDEEKNETKETEKTTVKTSTYRKYVIDKDNPGIMHVIDGNYDKLYFKDTLFIGDSRVEGLKLYSNAPDAHYFCSTGMDEFKLFKDPLYVDGVGYIYLEFLLASNKYKRIFLQLGINSLGYGFQNHLNHYKEVVNKIRTFCPDADLYLISNMHVATYKNEESKYINNKAINRFEVEVRKLVDDEHIFYIDINEFLDDETGGLNTEYTNDGIHLVPKYYDILMDIFQNLSR